MHPTIRIVNLEDDPLDTELVRVLLRKDGLAAEIDRVDTLSGFQEALRRDGSALILADYSLPGMDAVEALRLAREVRPEAPFVFLSGAIGEETAIEMLKLGQATTCSSSESSVSFPLCVEPCGRPRNTRAASRPRRHCGKARSGSAR